MKSQLSERLQSMARVFQQSIEGLDENNNDYCIAHDALHVLTGSGIDNEGERTVLTIEACLAGQEIPESMLDYLEPMCLIPSELLVELSTFLTNHFA